MKKRKNDISRLETIINNDRLGISEEFYQILSIDLENLLRDYFDFNKSPIIDISKQNGEYCVKIGFMATKLLNFNKVPK